MSTSRASEDRKRDESPDSLSTQKLLLLKSPLACDEDRSPHPPIDTTAPDLSLFGDRFEANTSCPQFRRHEEASLLELFFDLFFTANYTVFSQTQGVNSPARFHAYVGYFCLLWITWLQVGLYDVRFLTDSIFERAARGVHLGVMVGFAVVAPNFKPNDQNVQTMRTMSLILAISRFCLAIEYASIMWHIRQFRKQRLPMMLQVAINFIASMVYLGITFRFRSGGNSRVFVTWYVAAGLEVVLTFVLANIFSVLSFSGTHLMKRLSLLTVIILGDAIIVMCQNVVTIVKNPDAWNSQTIGIVTAATTTIYFIFLVYFDWMKHPKLPTIRQQVWTILHFPLHLALVLFMQGFTQFILWSKIIDVFKGLTLESILDTSDAVAHATSEEVKQNLTALTAEFFAEYPPKYAMSWNIVAEALYNISTIPDDYWPKLAKYADTLADADRPPKNESEVFYNAFVYMVISMENSVLERFNIDLVQEVIEEDQGKNPVPVGVETKVNIQTWQRFNLVFSYAYITAGLVLIFMVALSIISRITPWRRWSIIRTLLFTLLGIGLSLVALLSYSVDNSAAFRSSPWLLPAICLVWVVVLLLTHVRNPPPLLFKKLKKYDAVRRRGSTDVTETKRGRESQAEEGRRSTSYYGHDGNDRYNGV